ncbi:hypothetical protein [Deinococcus alpinitundrae]|uniref:hypothetical protein n=1 Tax=Deinococcus alpinitundrae TaxID=468913 RepID=UPI00137AEF10|nr:hypothetical protein [Deinococcus alpinitundrae]
MKKFTLLPLLLVSCGTLPAAPLGSLALGPQACSAACSPFAGEPDTSSRSYLVNFKEIVYLRANSSRVNVQFGKDAADPACLLSVKTSAGATSLERRAGASIVLGKALLDQSQWQMDCPIYHSGWSVF